MFWNELAAGHYYLVALEPSGEVVGYAGLAGRRRTRRGCRTSRCAGTRSAAGIGRALLTACWPRPAAGYPAVLLEVAVDNAPAQRLYARVRVRGDRRAQGYYQPSNTDALVMTPGVSSVTDEPLVLGIETSCDETGIGIVRGHTLLADAVASSVDEHARFGGVVPEVASRAHLEAMVPTMHRALADRRRDTVRHGRDRGDRRARAWPARCWSGSPRPRGTRWPPEKPIYGVNHLAAHVAVDTLEHGPLPEPAIALLVSGGHSSPAAASTIWPRGVTPLGATIDDAAGEAFDKVARLLGMPFPGGPPIDRAARAGDAGRDRVPARPDRRPGPGRAPVRLLVLRPEDGGRPLGGGPAAGRRAGAGQRRRGQLPGGGLRRAHRQGDRRLPARTASTPWSSAAAWRPTPGCGRSRRERAEPYGITVRVPRPGLCTDNGAMVAALGSHLVAAGVAPAGWTCRPTRRCRSPW